MSDTTAALVAPQSVKVTPYITADQIKIDLGINDTDIQGAFMAQAALFGHYSVLAVRAQRQLDTFKQLLEIKTAAFDRQARDALASTGGKITEKMVENDIIRRPEYVQLVKKINAAREIADLGKYVLEALKQKRDMLIQIGVARREEMKGEAAVRVHRSEMETMKDAALATLKRN